MSDGALPLRRAGAVRLAGVPALAARISYAGELGWELYAEPRWAIQLWDRLMAVGQPIGLEPFGYRALEGLRLEKGYRYFGTDLTMLDSPDEAGLGPFVRMDKGPFVGREAILARRAAEPAGPSRRLTTVTIGADDYVTVYGGEAVRREGAVVGRLRSAGYGPTIGRTIGTVYLPAGMAPGTPLEVDVFGRRVRAETAADVLVDPAGLRMRG